MKMALQTIESNRVRDLGVSVRLRNVFLIPPGLPTPLSG